mmetsp:Transcript_61527/g.170595  ORF Transcript_61527/g.170595 Transcript_61527/m.170595 type:complete len:154 (-) Transcript_61527:1969-2430(-)
MHRRLHAAMSTADITCTSHPMKVTLPGHTSNPSESIPAKTAESTVDVLTKVAVGSSTASPCSESQDHLHRLPPAKRLGVGSQEDGAGRAGGSGCDGESLVGDAVWSLLCSCLGGAAAVGAVAAAAAGAGAAEAAAAEALPRGAKGGESSGSCQ